MGKKSNSYVILFSNDWSPETCRAVNMIIRAELGYSEMADTTIGAIVTPKGLFHSPIEIQCDMDLGSVREIMDRTLKEIYFDDLKYDVEDQLVPDHKIALLDPAEKLLSVFQFDQCKDEFVHIEDFETALSI